MKKAELIKIAEKYDMDFIRHPVTREGSGVWCKSGELIPELDAIVEGDEYPVVGERLLLAGDYTYRIYCPTSWIDIWGWKD